MLVKFKWKSFPLTKKFNSITQMKMGETFKSTVITEKSFNFKLISLLNKEKKFSWLPMAFA